MAITKILPRNARLDQAIQYVVNGDKTDSQILTYYQNCDPGWAYQQMMDTKQAVGKTGGRQCYHIIQSFKPGEVTPELALEIAKEFAAEYLADYEVVIGTHTDRGHIHSHLVFNSVNGQTGKKYHITEQEYYRQIRGISDRLCRERGLSVILQGESGKAVSYIEWLRQSKGQPTFRSMLEADLQTAIENANDLGHFFLLMEHMGYEIHHGNRLGFRLFGQERFMYPGRKNPLFTEDGIRATIQGNLDAIQTGQRPVVVPRRAYVPYKKHPKYTGLLALYVHYLYVLGKIGRRQYPPRMTPKLKKDVMRFEQYREQFAFLRDQGITTQEGLLQRKTELEGTLLALSKQRTILNVRRKKRRPLYSALADSDALAPAKALYEDGILGMESEYARYVEAVSMLETCGIPKSLLMKEKAEVYEQLAQINQEIKTVRKQLALCREIQDRIPKMERSLQQIEKKDEVKRDEYRRR